jgi:hypothetical protein
MQFRLNSRFHGVSDHQVCFALDQGVEDRGVVAPGDDRRFLEMGPIEALVGTTRIDDDADARLIDRRDRPVFRLVAAMCDRCLAPEKTGLENNPIFWRSRVIVIPPLPCRSCSPPDPI